MVANADQMLIVTAVADPPPRSGFVERALIAAFVGNIHPILCLTKTDLTDPAPFAAEFADLDITVVEAGVEDGLEAVRNHIDGHVTALIVLGILRSDPLLLLIGAILRVVSTRWVTVSAYRIALCSLQHCM